VRQRFLIDRGEGWRNPGLAAGQQGQAAQADANQDGRAAADLPDTHRVAEYHGARKGADQRLEVQERPGDLG
jgi:hypothetical protein